MEYRKVPDDSASVFHYVKSGIQVLQAILGIADCLDVSLVVIEVGIELTARLSAK